MLSVLGLPTNILPFKNGEIISLGAGESLSVLSFNLQNDLVVELNGEGAAFEYRSLAVLAGGKNVGGENIGNGDGKINQKIKIYHNAPNTKSFLFARNILGGDARASFNGIIEAGRNCIGIKSRQVINSLLLSPSARAVSKPELKIYCDDVECSHGTTCGNLDGDALFFLQSRGICEEDARKILIDTFAREVALGHPNEMQKMEFFNEFK